jgi:membrane protease YdiL (CAAX protease family)
LISIIINTFILYWAFSDKLLKKRNKVVGGAIYNILIAFLELGQLIAIINIIVIMTAKREKKEDFPDKKKEMPVLKKETVTKEKIILAIVFACVYFSQFIWSKYIPNNVTIRYIIELAFDVFLMFLAIVFFMDLFSSSFKTFKNNFKAYYQNLIGDVGKFYLVYFAVAVTAALLLNTDVSANQKVIESLPLWLSIPLAIVYAPLVEETVFRGCIRRFIKNDKIFIVISGLAFGLIHTVLSEASLYSMLVHSIPYVLMGGFLAHLYVKSNNICTNIAFHCFHNSMAMILLILINGI